jgi:uncharacterized protein YutE (UPF0331/DUF86 family)
MSVESAHRMEVEALERELLTYLQSTLDIAERIQKLSPSRRMALVVTKLEEAQMRAERR